MAEPKKTGTGAPAGKEIRILVADDERMIRFMLEQTLNSEDDYAVSLASNGREGLEMVRAEPPDILLTDWMMPELDGLELIREVREMGLADYIFIILLTAKEDKDDIVAGLVAGADDYVTKRFNRDELLARVRTGARIVRTQRALRRANEEMRRALSEIKTLQGLLPICMDCKKIRDDRDYWQEVEQYIGQMTEAEFSHSLCPDCFNKRMAEIEEKD